jgi:putative addiction module killer protein
LRIDYGPGNRVYFMRRGSEIIVLLCGGDKSTQATDIKTAKRLALNRSEEHG